jgi:hypothetical protein
MYHYTLFHDFFKKNKKWGAHSCNSIYLGGIGWRVMFKAGPRQKLEMLSKK